MAVLSLPAMVLIIWLLPKGDSFLEYCLNLMTFTLNCRCAPAGRPAAAAPAAPRPAAPTP